MKFLNICECKNVSTNVDTFVNVVILDRGSFLDSAKQETLRRRLSMCVCVLEAMKSKVP